jgi:hypothetical protein
MLTNGYCLEPIGISQGGRAGSSGRGQVGLGQEGLAGRKRDLSMGRYNVISGEEGLCSFLPAWDVSVSWC